MRESARVKICSSFTENGAPKRKKERERARARAKQSANIYLRVQRINEVRSRYEWLVAPQTIRIPRETAAATAVE